MPNQYLTEAYFLGRRYSEFTCMYFVVDGSNIVRSYKRALTLRTLDRVVEKLEEVFSTTDIEVFVDASFRHRVRESASKDEYDELEKRINRGEIVQTPSRTQADHYILETARESNGIVVSLDGLTKGNEPALRDGTMHLKPTVSSRAVTLGKVYKYEGDKILEFEISDLLRDEEQKDGSKICWNDTLTSGIRAEINSMLEKYEKIVEKNKADLEYSKTEVRKLQNKLETIKRNSALAKENHRKEIIQIRAELDEATTRFDVINKRYRTIVREKDSEIERLKKISKPNLDDAKAVEKKRITEMMKRKIALVKEEHRKELEQLKAKLDEATTKFDAIFKKHKTIFREKDSEIERLKKLNALNLDEEEVAEKNGKKEANGGCFSQRVIPRILNPREVSLRGYLSDTSIISVLTRLSEEQRTGELIASSMRYTKEIGIRDGKLCFIISDILDECLGEILMRDEMISVEDHKASLKQMDQNEDKLQGEILVEMGSISQGDLDIALERQAIIKLADLFTWESGTYQFTETEIDFAAYGESVNFIEIILQSARAGLSLDRVIRDITPYVSCPPVLRENQTILKTIELTQMEITLLDYLGPENSLIDIVKQVKAPQAYRFLYILTCIGLLEYIYTEEDET